MKLYEAYSTVDQYRGHKNIPFHWFVHRRQKPIVTPEEAITDYAKLDEHDQFYALDYVNELLTESEVLALRDYLKDVHGTDVEAREIELPISGVGVMGVGALAVGGLTDFYMLSTEDDYDLVVPIWGYFSLENCEEFKRTWGSIVVGHDDEGETAIVITLRPGDGFSWEHPLTLIPHVSQMLEGIALSQLDNPDDDGLPF